MNQLMHKDFRNFHDNTKWDKSFAHQKDLDSFI